MESSADDSGSESECGSRHDKALRMVEEWRRASEKWIKLRTNALVVPLKAEGVRQSRAKHALRLGFDRVSNFKLPGAFSAKSSRGAEKTKLFYCLHVSLFSTTAQTFFGNTWVSDLQKPVSQSQFSNRNPLKLEFENVFVSMLTKITDSSCVAVVEVVVVEKDVSSTQVLGQYGCGWASLPVFSILPELDSAKRVRRKVQLFGGSPRALLFLRKDGMAFDDNNLQPILNAELVFSCSIDPQIGKIQNLLRLNELIGPGQPIAGISGPGFPRKKAEKLRLLSTCDLFVNCVTALLPVNWNENLLRYLEHKKRVSFRKRGSSSSFVLKIAPHNGRTVSSKSGWTQVTLKEADYSQLPDYDRALNFNKPLKLREVIQDKNIAIAFQLEHVLTNESKERLVFIIGSGIWLPFMHKSEEENKITLANADPRASATRMRLQIPLRTDLQCPFTDEGVFLPGSQSALKMPVLGLHLARRPEKIEIPLMDESDSDLSASNANRRIRKKKRPRNHFDGDEDFSSEERDDGNSSLGEFSSNDDTDSAPWKRKTKTKVESSLSSSSGEDDDAEDGNGTFFTRKGKNHDTSSDSSIEDFNERKRTKKKLKSQNSRRRGPAFSMQPRQDENSLVAEMLSLKLHEEVRNSPIKPTRGYTTFEIKEDEESKSASLSRASRTALSQNGITLSSMRTAKGSGTDLRSIEAELRDPLKANEITIQFAAFRCVFDSMQCAKPGSLFFTFQFYDCLPTRTERMILRPIDRQDEESRTRFEQGLSRPFILMRGGEDERHRNSPSLALKFLIDTNVVADESEPERFAKYLDECSLFIHVWDADSLLNLGVMAVPLGDLMRQGEKSRKVAGEYDVVRTPSLVDGSGVQAVQFLPKSVGRGEVMGRVQIIMLNNGFRGKGKRQIKNDQPEKENALSILHANMTRAFPSEEANPLLRVAARPLAESNPQLRDLISVARARDRAAPKRQKDAKFLGEAPFLESEWTISRDELRQLMMRLDRENCGQISIDHLFTYLKLDSAFFRDPSRIWTQLQDIQELANVQTYHVFNEMDVECSGHVTEKEFREYLQKVSGNSVQETDLDFLCQRFKEGRTDINYERFLLQLLHDRTGDLESKLRRILNKAQRENGISLKAAFEQHFDPNHDSKLQRKELRRGLRSLGFDASEKDIDILMHRYGENDEMRFSDFIALAELNKSNVVQEQMDLPPAVQKIRQIVLEAENRGVRLGDAFRHFDKNDDGRISISEAREGLKGIGLEATEVEIDQFFEAVDTDGNGTIELNEFIAFLRERPLEEISENAESLETRLRAVMTIATENGVDIGETFALFDEDGDGKISLDECCKGLEKIGFDCTPKQVKSLFTSWDFDVDGKVDLEELVKFVAARDQERDHKSSFDATFERLQQQIGTFAELHADEFEDSLESLEDEERPANIKRPELERVLKHFGGKEKDGVKALFWKFGKNGKLSEDILVSDLCSFLSDTAKRARTNLKTFLEIHQKEFMQRCQKHDRNSDGTISLSRFEKIVESLGWRGSILESDVGFLLNETENRVCYELLRSDGVQEKIVKAVQRATDRGFDIKKAIVAKDRSSLRKVSLVQIRELLVELGLAMLEESNSGSGLSRVSSGSVMGRQLDKVNRLRQTRAIRNERGTIVPFESESSDLFAREEAELDILRRFREGNKRTMVRDILQSSMTKEILISPSFAKTSYFEVEVANPFPKEERLKIEIDDAELRCIVDSEEWRYFRESVPPSAKCSNFYPVENEMITPETLELTLDAREAVAVPFAFVSFNASMHGKERTASVRVFSSSTGHTILLIKVHINPRPFHIDRAIHLSGVAGEFVKAAIHLRFTDTAETFVHCLDKDAAVQWREGAVFLKYRNPPQGAGEFTILLYADPFHANLKAVWQVCVQPMQRVDFHGVLGQSASKELIVKGDRFSRRVQCFTSNAGETQLLPDGPFQLVPGAFNRIELLYCPINQTPADSTSQILVHMVDIDTHELVTAWLVRASAALPDVSKTFEIELPLHEAAHKKIAYVNPWNEERTFTLRTSDPTRVKSKQPALEIAPKAKGYIRLWFAAAHKPTARDVLIFVNDENDQNEECLLIRTTHGFKNS